MKVTIHNHLPRRRARDVESSDAYEQGKKAKQEGKPITKNPYFFAPASPAYQAWKRGWEEN